jgi:hypothetical protein
MHLAYDILTALQDHRIKHHRYPTNEILLSIPDSQQMYDEWRAGMDKKFRPPRRIFRDGDTGTLWGRPCRTTNQLAAGHARIGDVKIVVKALDPPYPAS